MAGTVTGVFGAYAYATPVLKPLSHTFGVWLLLVALLTARTALPTAVVRSTAALLLAVTAFYVGKAFAGSTRFPNSEFSLNPGQLGLWWVLAVAAGVGLAAAFHRIGRWDTCLMSRWDEIRIVDEVPSGYVELPEIGLSALVSWFAGPENTVRLPDSLDLHVLTTTSTVEGLITRSERERSQDDQDIIDGDMDEYLAHAEILPRPHGFRWFLRLPGGVAPNELWPMINSHLATVGTHPTQDATAIGELLRSWY